MSTPKLQVTKEHERLRNIDQEQVDFAKEGRVGIPAWRRWGPYVSERSWGTVREDYSASGDAWNFLTHDMSRSKTYRWGEDGIAGVCDRYQVLCMAPAFWNETDPILKERLYGLNGPEGNHGEDVKEYYFHLDNTPTHSYMKYLYKYPQREYPYRWLVEENGRREGKGMEFELLDTGIFDDDRYFDIYIEHAKVGPDDILMRIEAFNRGPDDAPIHLMPHLWFRNTWGWGPAPKASAQMKLAPKAEGAVAVMADDTAAPHLDDLTFDYRLGPRYFYGPADSEVLFTNNETNRQRLYRVPNRTPYVKDAFHRWVIKGDKGAVNPENTGTKVTFHTRRVVPAGGSTVMIVRLCDTVQTRPFADADAMFRKRRQEADEFYATVHPPKASDDEKKVQRQALAGMLWTKQIYIYHVSKWLEGDDPANPPPEARNTGRNRHWKHLNSMRIMSVCDKWEYPWFAAWDLAFHSIPLGLVDSEFAKEQLWMLLFEQFQHPNGQIPAYEWDFSDWNPPVHAWAVWRLFNQEKRLKGKGDLDFLERCFHKLLINFACWVNKVDRQGNNVFEGGFLGLDNITVLDRSEKLPDGAVLEQSDATGWMGMFCLNMMRMALELGKERRAYDSMASKFFQHYIYVGAAMKRMGGRDYQLWCEEDGFFYDLIVYPDGNAQRLAVRSLVGLIPLYAVERLEDEWLDHFKEFRWNVNWFLTKRQDLVQRCCTTVERPGTNEKVHVLTVLNPEQLRAILKRVWDPTEFRSHYGMRSLSRYHLKNPVSFGHTKVGYEPAETDAKIKGGNSNWRGPVWFPTTFLMIESLKKLKKAYGDTFDLGIVREDGTKVDFEGVAKELADGMIRIFTRDEHGRRAVFGGSKKFQEDPHWKDHILFYEYFHADNGAGLGASHQTGWTGLVASLIDEWRQ